MINFTESIFSVHQRRSSHLAQPENKQKRKLITRVSLPASKTGPAKKMRTLKKAVRFQTKAKIAFYFVSKIELKQAWNQPEDMDAIKSGIRKTLAAFVQAQGQGLADKLDDNEYCFRGLEAGLSPPMAEQRKLWAGTTRKCILDEQRLQKKFGLVDDTRISAISKFCSEKSVQLAKKMAHMDFSHRP